MVSEQRGTEEYVHLKSVDDEFEYMESTLPKRDQQESAATAEQEATEDSATGCQILAVI